jgi:murein DD-endopeptidase MepM/ murein hydrolase activator NlpD
MLGIALSVGASGPLLLEPEMALAAEGSAIAVLPTVRSASVTSEPKISSGQGSSLAAYYTVEDGDSLWQIARQHQADVDAIKAANGISPEEVLRAGQVIRVPAVGLASSSEMAMEPRLALRSDVRGGVGGDLSATSPVAVLSPEESAKGWTSFDEPESAESLEAADDTDSVDLVANLDLADSDEEMIAEPVEEVPHLLAAAKVHETLAFSPDATEVETSTVNQWSVAEATAVGEAIALASNTAALDEVSAEISAVDQAPVDEVTKAAATPEPAVGYPSTLPLHQPQARPQLSVQPTVVEPEPSPEASAEVLPTASTQEAPELLAMAPREEKEDFVAALMPGAAAIEVDTAGSLETAVPSTASYSVKSGDTLWTIASSHGVTLDELLSHNHNIEEPEVIAVGDSISLPTTVNAAAEPVDEVASSSSRLSASLPSLSETRSRDEVIRDHLARIRESANTEVDREALNARIRQARAELERTRSGASDSSAVSLEYYEDSAQSGNGDTATVGVLARASQSQWTVTDVAQTEDTEVAKSAVAVISPRVNDPTPAEAIESSSDTVPDLEAGRQLLAAAPLEADAYRATPSLPTGQTVSPSMPMLPGSGEFLPEAPERFNGYIWPTHGTFTSGYGWRWGRMHRGIDIAGPVGTPIVAAASGVVVRSGWNSGGYGNLVDIRHPDGSMTRYAHNHRLLVREGQEVRQGQQIAEMGSTGYSTGPHLHFEVHKPNTGTVNPMAYLPSR